MDSRSKSKTKRKNGRKKKKPFEEEEQETNKLNIFGIPISNPSDETFKKAAEVLLNKYVIIIGKHSYRLIDVEFYLRSTLTGGDPFIHRAEAQRLPDQWYFHRHKNGTYKKGTYKGLDFSFGNGLNFGGILIRSIEKIGTKELEFVEGPCNVVDHILRELSYETIAELVNHLNGTHLTHDKQKPPVAFAHDGRKPHLDLRIERNVREKFVPIYNGPRVGLNLCRCKKEGDEWSRYISRDWRYVSQPCFVKKHKCTLVLAAFEKGTEDLHQVFNTREYRVKEWIENYEDGKTLSWDRIMARRKFARIMDIQRAYGYLTRYRY